uniref:Uncharacterized protein n=1 Tax=Romanomermis culicivorax TaxID=13658 RepID=A0A915K1W0_ROMCU
MLHIWIIFTILVVVQEKSSASENKGVKSLKNSALRPESIKNEKCEPDACLLMCMNYLDIDLFEAGRRCQDSNHCHC